MTHATGDDPDGLKAQFEALHPRYKRLCEEVSQALATALKDGGVQVHDIPKRAKDWESFCERLERKPCSDPWTEVEDFAGVRVICLYRDDIAKVQTVIGERFDVQGEPEEKAQEADRFGYQGRHFIVRLRDEWRGARYDDLKDLKCEIQVRTMAMDAWNTVSHHLDYKTEDSIPDHLKRDFHALSALFHVADTQFEWLRKAQQRSQECAERTIGTGPSLDFALDHDTLRAYLGRLYPNRGETHPGVISNLVLYLKDIGYKTIADVDGSVATGRAGQDEVVQAVQRRMGVRLRSPGALLVAALLAGDPRYVERDYYFGPCAGDISEIRARHGIAVSGP